MAALLDKIKHPRRQRNAQGPGNQGLITEILNPHLTQDNQDMATTAAGSAFSANQIDIAHRRSTNFSPQLQPVSYETIIHSPGAVTRPPNSARTSRPPNNEDVQDGSRSFQKSLQSPASTSALEVRQSRSIFTDIANDHSNLMIFTDHTLPTMVTRLRNGYEKCLEENQKLRSYITEHEEGMRMHEDEKKGIKSIKTQNERLLKELNKEKESVKRLDREITALLEEKIEIYTKNREEKERLIRDYKAEIKRVQDEASSKSSGLRTRNSELETEINKLKAAQEARIQYARDETANQWSKMQQELKERHQQEVREFQKANDMLNQHLNFESSSAENQRKQLLHDFEQKELAWKKNAKLIEEQLEAHYTAQVTNVMIEVEALKSELTEREHINGLTDSELSEQLELLTNNVREVSRVRWDTTNEHFWPYKETTIEGVPNPRKLKQQIVQSSIWTILFEQIFYTPFHAFAEEGAAMQREWTRLYGTDLSSKDFSHWPRPSQKSEAWRYQRMKSCTQALEQAGSTTLEMKRYKDGYSQSLSKTTRSISMAIEQLCFVDDEKRRAIELLVTRAARFWLSVSSEHYRVLVSLPNSDGNLLQGTRSHFTQVRLVVSPKLQRVGNSMGEALDKVETVGNCVGISEPYDLYG